MVCQNGHKSPIFLASPAPCEAQADSTVTPAAGACGPEETKKKKKRKKKKSGGGGGGGGEEEEEVVEEVENSTGGTCPITNPTGTLSRHLQMYMYVQHSYCGAQVYNIIALLLIR